MMNNISVISAANYLQGICHGCAVNGGWWNDPATGERINRNTGELLMLMVSELAEAMEADRKGLMDDKLTHRAGLEVELADCVIRIMDFAGSQNMDIGGAIAEKLEYNASRADHKAENRLKEGGKRY
jgi:NTP pyrophosphatase (non-canonical NTP hydrolase)